MKKLKTMLAFCAALTMMLVSLTSCNEDSSYRQLTPEEVQTAYYTVRGIHFGKMAFLKNKGIYITETDTVDITWSIDTDSTMTIQNFPLHTISEWITDAELKEEILKQPEQTVRCKIAFFQTAPIAYFISLEAIELHLNYGGKEHRVQLAFYSGGSSIGVYDITNKYMEIFF